MMVSDKTPLVLCRDQVRDVDRRAIDDYGMPGVVLMENAGRGAAEVLLKRVAEGEVCICCGKGNNAGDGFVVARHLENAGLAVTVLLAVNPLELKGDALVNFRILQKSGTKIIEPADGGLQESWPPLLATASWIVDALLGTGTAGRLREPFLSAIEAINASGRPVLAIDLPSGMDCDTGEVLGACVHAAQTVTFVARKPCFDRPDSALLCGDVQVVDIGVPRRLLVELCGDLARGVE